MCEVMEKYEAFFYAVMALALIGTIFYNPMRDPPSPYDMYVDDAILETDGFREGIEYVKANCSAVYGTHAGTVINYVDNPDDFVLKEPRFPMCIYSQEDLVLYQVAEMKRDYNATCLLGRQVYVQKILVREVYHCESS